MSVQKTIGSTGGSIDYPSSGDYEIHIRFYAGKLQNNTVVTIYDPEDGHDVQQRDTASRYVRVTTSKTINTSGYYDVYIRYDPAYEGSRSDLQVYTTNVVEDNDPGVWTPAPTRLDGVSAKMGGKFTTPTIRGFQVMKPT